MNPTINLLTTHRSIRAFTPEPIPADHLAAAISAGQAASTSSAVQAYCAINITDPAARTEIAALAGNQPYIESAPTFLLFCADSRRHRLAAEDHDLTYDARLEAFLVAAIDTSLFAQNVTIALESLGYGVCYIGGIRNDLPKLDALLDIPRGVYPLFGLCVGTPDPTNNAKSSQRPRLPLEAVLMQDRYHDDDTMRAHMRDYDTTYQRYLRDRNAKPAQVTAAWAPRMADYHSTPRRDYLAAYYTTKGARLD